MEFVETSIFTERITRFLTDEAYRSLQTVLAENPMYMIFVYDKTQQGDLTPEQVKVLRAYVEEGVL